MANSSEYSFSVNWFGDRKKTVWEQLIPAVKPKRILEIGSFEGTTATYLIEKCAEWSELELHCVDTWSGGVEHQNIEMSDVEQRFLSNIEVAKSRVTYTPDIHVHKGTSAKSLPRLLAEYGENYFDFVYVDGSHQAPDVLFDAVLGFSLLRVDGLLIFDDYLWGEKLATGYDPIRSPKMAIDAFININIRKLEMLPVSMVQIYLRKRSD